MFCEHHRLRTVCPACKAALRPAAPAHVDLPSGRAGALPAAEPGPAGEPRPRGPGKPLMPLRKTKRKATREEAEQAEAWWVRRGHQ